jgi:tripartite-type tricarboxylate transporter receptor subunit TctC
MRRREVLATTTLLATPATWAQQPRPLRLVVPYPPGGPLDIAARALAERVKDSLGVSAPTRSRRPRPMATRS